MKCPKCGNKLFICTNPPKCATCGWVEPAPKPIYDFDNPDDWVDAEEVFERLGYDK